MVDNSRAQQDAMPFTQPASIEVRKSNGVEAKRLGQGKGLDAAVGGVWGGEGGRDVNLQAGHAASPAKELWKTQQT